MTERVLVTGGAGFIGSHVAEGFAREGKEVTVLDNLSRSKLLPHPAQALGSEAWAHLVGVPGVELIKGDVRDPEVLQRLARDVQAIVHCAAQVAVTIALEDPRLDFEVNALGTLNVLEAARRSPSNPAVMFCSTNKVYGDRVNSLAIGEGKERYRFTDPSFARGIPETLGVDASHHTPYGASKLAADLYVQDYGQSYGLRTAAFRMSCIYGPRQWGVEDQGWVAHMVLRALENEPITIYGDGKQVRDVLFVEDLVQAFWAWLTRADNFHGEVFNIGGGPANTVSLLEFLALLGEITGRSPDVRWGPWRPGDQRVYCSDITKAKDLLAWQPAMPLAKGLARLVEWSEGIAGRQGQGSGTRSRVRV